MNNLDALRARMDALNDELLRAFLERMRLSEEIGLAKRALGADTYVPAREKQIVDAVRAGSGIYADAAERLFRLLMDESKARQRQLLAFSDGKSAALIGMPGCGKTTVGRLVSALTRMPFVDTDALFEARTGLPAGEYIETRGEAAFRDIESEILEEAAAKRGTLIATGGGAVVRSENRALLKSRCAVFWLERDPARLSAENRPLSRQNGITALFEARRPLYQETAHARIDNNGDPTDAAMAIYEALSQSLES